MIIKETADLVIERYGSSEIDSIRITDIRIGMLLTAVRLSDGRAGTAATFSADHPFCQRVDRDFGPLTPTKIKGTPVTEILYSGKESGIISSLRMAVLNALSSSLLEKGDYKIFRKKDPFDFLNLTGARQVTIVGAFQSYIRKISETGRRLNVLEMNEEALSLEQRKYFVPAAEYASVIPASDIVIITGQTLVNGTIDNILNSVSDGSQVIVTGPSSGILPDILFRNKVSVTGTLQITNSDILFDVVGEGGTGFHLFEYCAEKLTIVK